MRRRIRLRRRPARVAQLPRNSQFLRGRPGTLRTDDRRRARRACNSESRHPGDRRVEPCPRKKKRHLTTVFSARNQMLLPSEMLLVPCSRRKKNRKHLARGYAQMSALVAAPQRGKIARAAGGARTIDSSYGWMCTACGAGFDRPVCWRRTSRKVTSQ